MVPWWRGSLACLLACGPTTATGDGDASGSAGSSGESTSSVSASTSTGPGTGATTRVETTSGEITTAADGSSGSESGEDGVVGEWTGILFADEGSTSFHACGEVAPWWITEAPGGYVGCNGSWMHVSATLYGPGEYGPAGEWEHELVIAQVLASRPCFVQDCGGGPPTCTPEEYFCSGAHDCDLEAQDCVEGMKCIPVGIGFPTWTSAVCDELDPDPLQEGDPCTPARDDGIDPCDTAMICFAPNGAAEGTCTMLCEPEGSTCPDDCVSCGVGGIGLCLPECAAMSCDPGAPCAPPE